MIEQPSETDTETKWIGHWLGKYRRTGEAPTGVAAALQRMLDAGVDPADLTAVVRSEQRGVLYNVCQLVDGEWLRELRKDIPKLPVFSWRLYEVEVDENYAATPVKAITDLHAQLGDLEPGER